MSFGVVSASPWSKADLEEEKQYVVFLTEPAVLSKERVSLFGTDEEGGITQARQEILEMQAGYRALRKSHVTYQTCRISVTRFSSGTEKVP